MLFTQVLWRLSHVPASGFCLQWTDTSDSWMHTYQRQEVSFFFFFLQEVVFRLLDLMFCVVINLTFALLCRNMFYDARGEKSETIFAVSKDLCFTIVICAFVSIILLIQNHTWICFALFPNENRWKLPLYQSLTLLFPQPIKRGCGHKMSDYTVWICAQRCANMI